MFAMIVRYVATGLVYILLVFMGLAAPSSYGQGESSVERHSLTLKLDGARCNPKFAVLKRLDPKMSPGCKIRFSPDGKYLACLSLEKVSEKKDAQSTRYRPIGIVLLWNVREKTLIRKLRNDKPLSSICFTTSSDMMLVGTQNGVIKLWRVADGKVMDTLQTTDDHPSGGQQVALSPNGKSLLSWNRVVSLWDYHTKKHVVLPLEKTLPGADCELGVFAHDSEKFLLASSYRSVSMWNTTSGKLLRSFNIPEWTISDVAFSPDGRFLAMAAGSPAEPGWIRVWDARTLAEITAVRAFGQSSHAVSFSPNGKFLIAGGVETKDGSPFIRIWEVATGKQIAAFSGKGRDFASMALSPDAKVLAIQGVEAENAPETSRWTNEARDDIYLYDIEEILK